jgi:hypothetical protein
MLLHARVESCGRDRARRMSGMGWVLMGMLSWPHLHVSGGLILSDGLGMSGGLSSNSIWRHGSWTLLIILHLLLLSTIERGNLGRAGRDRGASSVCKHSWRIRRGRR